MERLYLRVIENADDVFYLLKYLKSRSGDLTNEYDSKILQSVYDDRYIVSGLFHQKKCKSCETNWEIIQIGLIYMQADGRILDMIDFNIDIKYKDKDTIKKLVSNYLKSFFNRQQEEYFEEIKVHSRIHSKEYYEEYFGTKLLEYNTYVWEG